MSFFIPMIINSDPPNLIENKKEKHKSGKTHIKQSKYLGTHKGQSKAPQPSSTPKEETENRRSKKTKKNLTKRQTTPSRSSPEKQYEKKTPLNDDSPSPSAS